MLISAFRIEENSQFGSKTKNATLTPTDNLDSPFSLTNMFAGLQSKNVHNIQNGNKSKINTERHNLT